MADDFTFSKNVSDVRGAIANPELQRKTEVQVGSTPDFQSATQENAASSNFLGSIGAQVAQSASNAVATQLGGESGKNPHGNLFPTVTDFDKNFEESYHTQAHAVLGLQAEQLITESNLRASQASRITPDLIASTQDNISKGLQKIYALAPDKIRPQLEATYGEAQLSQVEQLNKRMLNEQHEDRRNNTILSNDRNAELGHSLAVSGKYDAADALVKTTESINNSAIAGNIGFTPQQGKVGVDTVRQAVISGKLQHQYDAAVAEGKGDEYLKTLAKKPDWISDADYQPAIQSIRSYANNQIALKSNYEQLTMSQFQEKLVTNASAITGTELQSTLDKLSPINASKTQIAYVSAIKSQQQDNQEQSNLNLKWDDVRAQANAPEKIKNSTFNSKVAYAMKSNPDMTIEQAENQVAASAGGEIPVFTKTLKGGLWSGDPALMTSASQQIASLQMNGNGHALEGLSEQDKALASDIKHNYNPADPASAARIIAENKQNMDPDVRKDSETAFANQIYDNTRKSGKAVDDYVLETFGMQGGMFHQGFDSPWAKSSYASDIKSNWNANFINTGRDEVRAKELTQQYVKDNYGKTSFNGSSEWTLHPIEKACGFSEGDGLPAINNDIVRQLEKPFAKLKDAYDAKTSDEYWTIAKQPIKKTYTVGQTHPFQETERLMLTQHKRNGVANDVKTFPLRLVGNNYNWEINVDGENGPINVFLAAPFMGVHTYTPDIDWIKNNYKETL